MTNGYALCTRVGLDAITEHLKGMTPVQLDALRGRLRVGVHSDVEVTDVEGSHRPRVSQVFCFRASGRLFACSVGALEALRVARSGSRL